MLAPTKRNVHGKISTWPELGINYWGIHKNASTTLTDHFVKLVGNNVLHSEWLPDNTNEWTRKKTAKKRAINGETALTNGLINFCVVRNPLDRFYSCYSMFKYPKDKIQTEAARRAHFDSTDTPTDFADKILLKFKRNIIRSGNKHFWKQVWYLPSNVKQLDYIVKLENLQQDWPFDFPCPDYKINISNKIEQIEIIKQTIYEAYKDDYESFGYLL